MAKIIGLAGNIGSGKSLAASMLQSMGAAVIDADILARQIVQPGCPAYKDIVTTFGEEYLLNDGNLDRKKLAALIFRDEAARLRLNAITHPRIFAEAARLIDEYRNQGYKVIILEAALLLESGSLSSLLNETWLVTAPAAQIYQRLSQRDNLTPEQAATRLAAQMPASEQAKLAKRIIVNEGGKEDLYKQLALLYQEISGMHTEK